MAIEWTAICQMSMLRTRHFNSSLADTPSTISNNHSSLSCFTSSCSNSVGNYDSIPPEFGLYATASYPAWTCMSVTVKKLPHRQTTFNTRHGLIALQRMLTQLDMTLQTRFFQSWGSILFIMKVRRNDLRNGVYVVLLLEVGIVYLFVACQVFAWVIWSRLLMVW